MTISQPLTEGSQAFEGCIHHSQDLSNRQLNAVGNFSTTAIRGHVIYDHLRGYQPSVLLPCGPSAYTPLYDGFAPSQTPPCQRTIRISQECSFRGASIPDGSRMSDEPGHDQKSNETGTASNQSGPLPFFVVRSWEPPKWPSLEPLS